MTDWPFSGTEPVRLADILRPPTFTAEDERRIRERVEHERDRTQTIILSPEQYALYARLARAYPETFPED